MSVTARESASAEYLACLFLLLVDNNRYGPLKSQLDNTFLMGEQEYPCDVLQVKRLMTDFVPEGRRAEPKREKISPTDVVFMEREQWLDCY